MLRQQIKILMKQPVSAAAFVPSQKTRQQIKRGGVGGKERHPFLTFNSAHMKVARATILQ